MKSSQEVLTWKGPGTWRTLPLDAPGAYQLEVLLVPHHLKDALGTQHALADSPLRWVETNPVYVVSTDGAGDSTAGAEGSR